MEGGGGDNERVAHISDPSYERVRKNRGERVFNIFNVGMESPPGIDLTWIEMRQVRKGGKRRFCNGGRKWIALRKSVGGNECCFDSCLEHECSRVEKQGSFVTLQSISAIKIRRLFKLIILIR